MFLRTGSPPWRMSTPPHWFSQMMFPRARQGGRGDHTSLLPTGEQGDLASRAVAEPKPQELPCSPIPLAMHSHTGYAISSSSNHHLLVLRGVGQSGKPLKRCHDSRKTSLTALAYKLNSTGGKKMQSMWQIALEHSSMSQLGQR